MTSRSPKPANIRALQKTALVREALKALIQREAARRLAALGGIMPDLEDIPRLRVDDL